jgi:gluconolactonase
VNIEIRDSRVKTILSENVELETVASGFEFTEGPIWHPYEKHLTFSDIVGSAMYRWDRTNGILVFRKPSSMANGNTYDKQGRIVTCEHATSRVTRTELDGNVVVLASHYNGKELNSPNDIVVKSDGALYFSDPSFGRRPRVGIPRPQDLNFQAAFRFDPVSNTLTPIISDFENPNGLCLSLDEKQLYVNDSPRYHIRVFDVLPDGTVTNGRVWAEVQGEGKGVPDGMKFDSAGNLFCAGPGGIYIFDLGANCLAKIPIPEQAANFCWGGDDLCSFFITASTTLYRIQVKIPGITLF